MSEEYTEIDSKMKHLIAAGHIKGISEELLAWADPEVADYILRLDKPHQIMVYRALPRLRAANIFAFFEPDDQDTFSKPSLIRILVNCLPI
jgi:Mg/Co/Ni transporter MgtE